MFKRILIATALVLSVACHMSTAAGSWIEVSRGSYENKLRQIQSAPASQSSQWHTEYMRELKTLEDSAQARGLLDDLLAIRAEIGRFRSERQISADALATTPAGLRELQQKYVTSADANSRVRSQAIADLAEKYLAYLEKQKKDHTIAGDVASALTAKEEIARVKASEAVKAAMVDIDASSDAQTGEGAAEKVVTNHKVPSGYVVFPLGERPPRVSGEVFTRLSLTKTGNTPVAALAVAVGASRNTSASVRQQNSRYATSKSTTKTSSVRLQVRATRSGVTLDNKIVNIQFFTRPAGGNGRASPTRVSSGSVHLNGLTSAGVYIDCPDVSSTRSSSTSKAYTGSRSRSSRSSRSTRSTASRSSSGSEFYGILVNVYNSDGSLSYQGISAHGLKEHAAAATRRSEKDRLRDELAPIKALYGAARKAYMANTGDSDLRQRYVDARSEYSRANEEYNRASN